MQRKLFHQYISSALLCTFLFCAFSVFSIGIVHYNQHQKNVSAYKHVINIDSFFSELEEEDDCIFEALTSNIGIGTFNNSKYNFQYYELNSISKTKYQFYILSKQPLFIKHNVFRI